MSSLLKHLEATQAFLLSARSCSSAARFEDARVGQLNIIRSMLGAQPLSLEDATKFNTTPVSYTHLTLPTILRV